MAKTKEERNQQRAEYRKANRELIRERDKLHYKNNSEVRKAKAKQYHNDNKDVVVEKQKVYAQTIDGRYQTYKSGASRRELVFSLTKDDFELMWQQPCHFCGGEINTIGLDRLDNSGGYVKQNVVSCCAICNYMKYTHSVEFFLDHVAAIVEFNESPFAMRHYNKPRTQKYYSLAKGQAKVKGLEFLISKNEFTDLIYHSCVYCGSTEKIGVDRIDSNYGYVTGNVTSCCKTCNHMKKQLSVSEFLSHVNRIYNRTSR